MRAGGCLQLHVSGVVVDVLTGIYSDEIQRPQPLQFDVIVELALPDRPFRPETPLAASMNYMDVKEAVISGFSPGRHFTLIESVADHLIARLMRQDPRVARVDVGIVKLAISAGGERIGIRLARDRTREDDTLLPSS